MWNHREDKHGWVYISVSGENSFQRGQAYGKLIQKDLERAFEIIRFITLTDFGVEWSFFVNACTKYYLPHIQSEFFELYEEMRGIADGSNCSTEEIVAWNNYFTLTESWWAHMPEEESQSLGISSSSSSREGGGGGDRCSAIMANGHWTNTGEIVMAHNNFSNFADGQLAKYVVHLAPINKNGYGILMVSFPGWIWSGTDFFVTTAGIMGCETTIGGFTAYEQNVPISCRIRQAMEFGSTLDDYVSRLLDGNSGDYANSWLFGDTNTNEILRLELGLKYHSVERTMDGYFIGFNAAYDPRIRNLECVNSGFEDIRRHQGARRVRLEQLMKLNEGKITMQIAETILADHYDVYTGQENHPCSRTCCAHYELDKREYISDPSRPKPFQPRGAVDGNVCDSALAKQMGMRLRWGTSCGTPFDKQVFCAMHPQWNHLEKYLEDRPSQPWTTFYASTSSSSSHLRTKQTHKQKKHPSSSSFIPSYKTKKKTHSKKS